MASYLNMIYKQLKITGLVKSDFTFLNGLKIYLEKSSPGK